MTCTACCELDKALDHFEYSLATGKQVLYQGPLDFSLGNALEIESRSTQCESCRSILAAIEPENLLKKFRTPDSTVTAHFASSNPRMFLLAGDFAGLSSTDFNSRRASIHRFSHVPCLSPFRVSPDERRGRECDAETIDLELVQKWMNRCDETHQQSCVRKYDLHMLPTASLNFIDVEDLCIVTPPTEVRYVALSYVWGGATTLCATKSNIAELRQTRAFLSDRYQLPRTVSDAVTLCFRLRIRYLWVDSVCIVQDDPESLREQLQAMATVYGKAYLTIAALQSEHADAGIARVGSADSVSKPQTIISLPSRTMIVPKSPPAVGLNALAGTKWNSRGWTLQEHVFSRRILALNNLATWVCFKDQWTEDVELPTEFGGTTTPADTNNEFKLGAVTWPSIQAYGNLASEYAKRQLSYASDSLNAFAGILTPMNGWFPGGLLHGIAEFTFDAGLLWNPRRGGSSLRSNHRTRPSAEGSIKFPTWSWISWEGSIQFDLWNLSEDYVFPKGPLLLKPLVTWQKRLVTTGNWVNVDNTYHVVRAHFAPDKIPPASIPEGWLSRTSDANNEVYYQHEGHNHVTPWPRFAYPIPPFVRPRDMDRQDYYPYLRFRGKVANLKLSIGLDQRSKLNKTLQKSSQTSDVDIVTREEKWVGRLRLNLQKDEVVPPADETIEVIAISEGVMDLQKEAYARYVFSEVNEREELMELAFYEMVNVLWIGWLDSGMAYRQALGRIWKPAWKQLVTEHRELLLT